MHLDHKILKVRICLIIAIWHILLLGLFAIEIPYENSFKINDGGGIKKAVCNKSLLSNFNEK